MANPPGNESAITRAEFEQFLHVFTHEIRNRLNDIALEATDLSEQAGGTDAARLQQQIQDCSAFLKRVRESLAPDAPQGRRAVLAEFVKKLREHSV
jgi:light-regulated signal transduction histidine kinase (bacteriophytochrome)